MRVAIREEVVLKEMIEFGAQGGRVEKRRGEQGKEQAKSRPALQNSRGGGGVCPLGQCTNLGPAFRLVRVRSDRVSTQVPGYLGTRCARTWQPAVLGCSAVCILRPSAVGAPSNIPTVCFITVMSTTVARDMPPLISRISPPVPRRHLSCPPQGPASTPPSSSDPS